MRRAIVVVLVAFAALVAAGRAFAAQCGLPDSQPWWVDFSDGSVSFRNELFGRPGIIAASEGGGVAAALRARGATTIYWNMNLFRQVGTNVAPAPADGVVAAADRLFDAAAAGSVCTTPLIALNELLGQRSPPPWSPETSLYRANVLALLDELKKRGARPFLLLTNSQPNFDGDSFLWWQRVAQDADLVREIYFNAPTISAQRPLLASRTLRMGLRDAARPLLQIGMPASHVGLMLGFHTGTVSGRVGLQPREAWLEYVKLNVLAAKQVVRELNIGSIWSWGWGTFGPGSADADKPAAACVYLWTRDQKLCDGPSVAGPSFDTSLTEGQITLPAGVQCSFGSARIQTKAIAAASALTHDPAAGFGAIFARAVQRARVSVTSAEILRAERGIVRTRFGGQTARYRAALKQRRMALDTARGAIGDELRRNKLAPLVGGDVKGWTEAAQKTALATAICLQDQLPPVGDVRLATYAPFLALARA